MLAPNPEVTATYRFLNFPPQVQRVVVTVRNQRYEFNPHTDPNLTITAPKLIKVVFDIQGRVNSRSHNKPGPPGEGTQYVDEKATTPS